VNVRLTDRDRDVLAFVADHRLVLAEQVQALLGVSARTATARLGALASAGLLSKERVFFQQPACYQITRQGLGAIGSELRAPRGIDLSCYAHDVGLGWVWLAARAGAFGRLRGVLSERQLRSRDARPERASEPLAVRLGGFGPAGRARLHYPDLLLHTASGHRVAVELELSGKGRVRREKILTGYAADARIDAVLYLVRRPGVARELRASAAKVGISSLVHVQSVQWGESMRALDRSATAQRAPAPKRARAPERLRAPRGASQAAR
jgi:hypothetical protein